MDNIHCNLVHPYVHLTPTGISKIDQINTTKFNITVHCMQTQPNMDHIFEVITKNPHDISLTAINQLYDFLWDNQYDTDAVEMDIAVDDKKDVGNIHALDSEIWKVIRDHFYLTPRMLLFYLLFMICQRLSRLL